MKKELAKTITLKKALKFLENHKIIKTHSFKDSKLLIFEINTDMPLDNYLVNTLQILYNKLKEIGIECIFVKKDIFNKIIVVKK